MNVKQIEQVLTEYGVRFKDVDYPRAAKRPSKLARLKKEIPYTKFMYAGAESGLGAMLGFKVHGGDERSPASSFRRFNSFVCHRHTISRNR